MEHLVAHFGYAAVFLGTLVEGETFILLGGFLAHSGYLRFIPVVSVASLGAFSGDIFYFLLGRHYGRPLLAKSRRAAEMLPWLERFMQRYHILWIFGARYLYGIRWLASAIAGSSGVPLVRFAALTLPACLIWALVVGFLGYAMGGALERVLGDLTRYEGYLLIVVAVTGAIYGWTAYRRERYLARREQR